MKYVLKIFLLIALIIFFSGCTKNFQIANNNIAVELDTNSKRTYQLEWQDITNNAQFKEIPVYDENQIADVITVFKFAPDKFSFAFKESSEALSISQWREKTNALFISNGSYFLEDNQPSGILKINGNIEGNKLSAASVGEVVIDDNGQLDILENANIDKYDNVMQSYPLLITPNINEVTKADSGQVASRTVLAKDNEGNVLFIYTQNYYFSLYKLQNYLKKTDLKVEIALNLDGGQSTGYSFQDKIQKESDSQPVANIIIINKKTPN